MASKTLQRILTGSSDSNIRFQELRELLRTLGFSERIRGSHHIFTKPPIQEILNIQQNGIKAKAYQVKQVRNMILRYRLAGEEE